MSRIGFVGVGNMGYFMASNLIKHGKKVLAFDVSSTATGKIQAAGAELASTPREAAERSEGIVVTMLPANDHVREAYLSDSGILSGLRPGSLCVDCSTIEPTLSRELAKKAADKKITFADAPVSGGINAAREGTLTFMVGCEDSQLEKIKRLLEMMGKAIHHCGPVGAGEAAKICNNMLLGISMVGVSEAMNLGQKLGLDPKKMAAIINSSSGRCWSSEMYNPVPGLLPNVPASNDYNGGFGCSLMAKDLGLAVSSAQSTGSLTPLGSLTAQIYKMVCQHGYANRDFAAVYKYLTEKK